MAAILPTHANLTEGRPSTHGHPTTAAAAAAAAGTGATARGATTRTGRRYSRVPSMRRGPLAWHLRKPMQVSRQLAIKNHFVAMVGEFVGTCLFMIFALGGTNVANIPTTSVTGAVQAGQSGSTAAVANTSNLLYIALSFGFSLAVNAWIFFRVSGGLFNPAVSLGMALVGALTPLRAVLLTFSQILGGIVGSALIQALLPGTLNVRTQLSADTSVVRGLFIEMFLTSMLMITILLLAAEKHKATFLAPIGIGLSLFVAELLGVYYTGGSLNPARSFGPSVVLRSFNSYHWIYWLGPALGAMLAAGFYKFIKYLEYETVLGPEVDEIEIKTSGKGATAAAVLLETNGGITSSAQNYDAAEKGQGVGGGSSSPFNTSGSPGNLEKSSKGMMGTMGAGLGDLLTAGDTTDVFDLPQPPHNYEGRLERIEGMLSQLLINLQSPVHQQRESVATSYEGNRSAHHETYQQSAAHPEG